MTRPPNRTLEGWLSANRAPVRPLNLFDTILGHDLFHQEVLAPEVLGPVSEGLFERIEYPMQRFPVNHDPLTQVPASNPLLAVLVEEAEFLAEACHGDGGLDPIITATSAEAAERRLC